MTVKEGLRIEKMHSGAKLMLDTLKYLKRCGGLGFEKHDMIDKAIEGATFKDD